MNFQEIKVDDYSRLKPFFENQKYPLCVYSLSSIICWSTEAYQPYGTIHNDSLIVYANFKSDPGKRYLLLPISATREFDPGQLAELARKTGIFSFSFVPETYVQYYGQSRIQALFNIEAQEEFHDYVFLTEDLAKLKGNRYAKKRNLIRQFERNYLVSPDRVCIDPISAHTKQGCIDFLEEWCRERNCDKDPNEDLACEKQALINALNNMDRLEMRGILLQIDGKICAIAIASGLTDTMGLLQFEKAFAGIKGLYQYFDNQCARRLFPEYAYINKESDMGDSGLAKAKKSYHPVIMIHSYRLTLRCHS